jgi:hypothetical protein
MTKEIRSPNVERGAGIRSGFRHSAFGIRSDFVIGHSGLGRRFMESLHSIFGVPWVHDRAGANVGQASRLPRGLERETESEPAVGFADRGRRDAGGTPALLA